MDRFNALGRGAQIMLIGAVLLFIDLFLPWQDFDIGGIADEFGVDATFSGWRGIGAVLGIVTIALIVWLGVRIAGVDFKMPVSGAMVSAALGALILVFGIIKWITIIDDEATIWAWIGLVLCLVIAFGAWQSIQAEGGMNTLRTEMQTMQTSRTDTRDEAAAPAAPPPPPPPPTAEPEAAAPPPAAEPMPPAEEAPAEPDEPSDRPA